MLKKIVLDKYDNDRFRVEVFHTKMIKVLRFNNNKIFIHIFKINSNGKSEHTMDFPFESKCLESEIIACFGDLVPNHIIVNIVKSLTNIHKILNNMVLNIKVN